MVVSAFQFFNEVGLLRLRLEYLSDFVDRYLLVESTVTHGGLSKPLYFDEVKDQFKDYPITHVIVDDAPLNVDPWARAWHQKTKLHKALRTLNPEIVIFTDADEIPATHVIQSFLELSVPVATLVQDQLLFYADRVHHDTWISAKICRKQNAQWTEPDRSGDGTILTPMIPSAGWHFAYTGSKEHLLEKINATSHCMGLGARTFWRQCYQGKQPGLHATSDYPRSKLPECVQKDPARYGLTFYTP